MALIRDNRGQLLASNLSQYLAGAANTAGTPVDTNEMVRIINQFLGEGEQISSDLTTVTNGIYKKFGAIDKNGKIIVPINYDYLTPFRNGIAVGLQKNALNRYFPILISSSGQLLYEGSAILTWLTNEKVILINSEEQLVEYSPTTKTRKVLENGISDIRKFKEFLTFTYKNALIYSSVDFLTWYADKKIDFSAYDAQQFVQSGNTHRSAKEYSEALLDYQKALRKSPNNFEALLGIAENYKDQNSSYNAIEYIDKAILNANNFQKSRAFSLKFEIYKGQSNWAEAINVVSQIINLEEYNKSQWYLERGYCRLEQRSFSNAIDDISTSFQGENPVNSAYAYNLRGICYGELKMYSYAAADYKKATVLGESQNDSSENMGIFFTNLGYTYLKLNKISDAKLAFKRAAGLGNQNAARELRYNSNFK
jgi:tetratricopeptide (TPR) repeat protein